MARHNVSAGERPENYDEAVLRLNMDTLVGKHIILRQYISSDSRPIHNWRNDKATTRWMGPKFAQPLSFEETAASLNRVIDQPATDAIFFAIADKRTHEYVGGIDLTSIDWKEGTGVLSIVIGESANRGKGYGTEAIGLLLAHAFETVKLHRVSLNVVAENQAAVRCYRKCGFRITGPNNDRILVDGEYSSLIHMTVSAFGFRFRNGLKCLGAKKRLT